MKVGREIGANTPFLNLLDLPRSPSTRLLIHVLNFLRNMGENRDTLKSLQLFPGSPAETFYRATYIFKSGLQSAALYFA